MAATSRVLNIVELLENVLLYLPMRDKLLAQRVSKHWHGVIYQSIKLQRALFFEPDKGKPLILARDDHNVKKHWVMLQANRETRVVRNRLLEPLFELGISHGKDHSLAAGLPSSWCHPEASWRRMLPAQPAVVTSALVTLSDVPDFWCPWYTEKVLPLFCTGDVRIGELFDELEKKFGCFPYGRKQIIIVGLDVDDWVCEKGEEWY